MICAAYYDNVQAIFHIHTRQFPFYESFPVEWKLFQYSNNNNSSSNGSSNKGMRQLTILSVKEIQCGIHLLLLLLLPFIRYSLGDSRCASSPCRTAIRSLHLPCLRLNALYERNSYIFLFNIIFFVNFLFLHFNWVAGGRKGTSNHFLAQRYILYSGVSR